MSNRTGERKDSWTPPPRPEWVARINAEGDAMDIRSVVPLDEDSLIGAATRKTGLSDFGDDDWRPHFRFIIRALEEEGDLNLMGRLTARAHLLNILEGRLQIEEAYRQHPEIEDQKIVQPIFIIGQGRSGTSALHNLLAHDPDNGALLTWEAMYPVPAPEASTYRTDPRIEVADKLITQWQRIVPTTASIHEFGGPVPTECVQITSYAFLSQWFVLLGQITSYGDYMAKADWSSAYRYHERALKLLQWKNPRKHWLLKSPTHMPQLPKLLERYPDALLIWPHRDPVKAIASVTSLAGNRNWVTSDRPRVTGYEQYSDSSRAAKMLEAPIDWIEAGVIAPERLCNVYYADLISEPMRMVEDIYRHFGLPLSAQARLAMETYLADHPREARPAHAYTLGEDELVKRERALFARYTDYFKVPLEA